MKNFKWQFLLGSSLIFLSFLLYSFQINLFHEPRNTWFYFFQDVAFIPIQVLLVTLIIDQLLSGRERKQLLNKMNMVIGAFFSECGTELLKYYIRSDKNIAGIRKELLISGSWDKKAFKAAMNRAKKSDLSVDAKMIDLSGLKALLCGKKEFLLRLLENPNLLEHDTFTDLLWAVFHLTEELDARSDLKGLSKPDSEHISLDMKRAFSLLIYEWLSYMKHLRAEYPYLFSLSVRMNPFDPAASAEIK